MIIKRNCYVITTKSSPMQFDADENLEGYSDGEFTDYIEDAFLYLDEKAAQEEINSCFDDPDLYNVIQVSLTYEF